MKLQVLSSTCSLTGTTEYIRLLPMGHISSTNGDFFVDVESYNAMKKHLQQRKVDIVVDYEHQTLKNVQAPASGWIKEIVLRDDCIGAIVEWTTTAKQYIQNKEYRYLSPVVMVRKNDNKVCQLHSVALTNTPAINGMYPIVNSSCNDISLQLDDSVSNMDKLKRLLNISEADYIKYS